MYFSCTYILKDHIVFDKLQDLDSVVIRILANQMVYPINPIKQTSNLLKTPLASFNLLQTK